MVIKRLSQITDMAFMAATFLLDATDDAQRVLGWVFIVMGFLLFAWAAFDHMTGETSEGSDSCAQKTVVLRDQEPAKFQRIIVLTVFGGLVCLASGVFLLG